MRRLRVGRARSGGCQACRPQARLEEGCWRAALLEGSCSMGERKVRCMRLEGMDPFIRLHPGVETMQVALFLRRSQQHPTQALGFDHDAMRHRVLQFCPQVRLLRFRGCWRVWAEATGVACKLPAKLHRWVLRAQALQAAGRGHPGLSGDLPSACRPVRVRAAGAAHTPWRRACHAPCAPRVLMVGPA